MYRFAVLIPSLFVFMLHSSEARTPKIGCNEWGCAQLEAPITGWRLDTQRLDVENVATGDMRPIAVSPSHRSHGVNDLVAPLGNKVQEILTSCHSKLVSGYRPGARVAGTNHPSLHSVYPSKAADLAGNPGCIYAHLRGWQGGYSTDYGHVRHVHVSWSPPGSGHLAGREWHCRFVHGGGSHHRVAYRTKSHYRHVVSGAHHRGA